MNLKLHENARTTPAIRRQLRESTLSKPLRQSEFDNCLVAPMGQMVDDKHMRRSEHIPPIRSNTLGGRVLVADDNPVNQELAAEMLELMGLAVDVVGNGREAVEAVLRIDYDVVLMDCQMPEVDGYEATEEIRRQERWQEAPVRSPIIALTANALEGDRERCLAAGMDDHLSKPFNSKQLYEMLQRWLARKPEIGVVTPESTDLADMGAAPERKGSPHEQGKTQLSDSAPPLDSNVLAGIHAMDADGASGLVRRLLEKYADRSGKDLRRLETAITAGDAVGTRQAAHSMKSSSGSIGALHLASLCQELETAALHGRLDNAPDLLAKIGAEHGRTRIALTREIPDLA